MPGDVPPTDKPAALVVRGGYMFSSGSRTRVALFAGVLACLICPPAALAAGTPATVSVRVEGLTQTKLASTIVTTTTTPVVKDGVEADSCSGTSALGALQLASAGNWGGQWEASLNQYSIFSIEGENHEFEEGAAANYYWAFWIDNKYAQLGACETELQPGDQVLFFPSCYGSACPKPEPTPLGIEAPATANSGETITVTVKQYKEDGSSAPAVGAQVGGGGAGATTDSQGHATLKLVGDGTYTLTATAAAEGPPAIRAEATVCVHEGNDGTCGTSVAKGVEVPPPGSTGVVPISHPKLTVASTGIRRGRKYSRRHAPRLLAGKVAATVPVTVSISLRRTWHKRCWSFSGSLERFVKVRCGRAGSFFEIQTHGGSFSYLLPHKLPAGRYVYEIEATDSAHDRSSSKTTFHVG
jgi:hypothetical protein